MNLQTIEKQLLIADEQIKKLKEGKKVAGTQARQALLAIKKDCDKLRKEVLEHVKNMPPKTAPVQEEEVEEELPPPVPLTRESTSVVKKKKK